MSRVLTVQTLIDKGACSSQVELFRSMFGEQVRVTQKLCASVADKFDFIWAASHLLSAPALAEYERACAPARAEYERVRASAWAECDRACAPAWAEYQRARAPAFAKAYNGDK